MPGSHAAAEIVSIAGLEKVLPVRDPTSLGAAALRAWSWLNLLHEEGNSRPKERALRFQTIPEPRALKTDRRACRVVR